MDKLWHIIYNLLALPLLYIVALSAGIFNQKIRAGIKGRKRLFEDLILQASRLNKQKKLIWFHSASMGEFEQAKPIIEQLRSRNDINILVTFFSPSGYENSRKYPHADIISYIPFDTIASTKKFVQVTRPAMAVFMRYDIWPNMIRSLHNASVPILLVDATMRDSSPRKLPLIRSFHRHLFSKMSAILTVSENDARNFSEILGNQAIVAVAGDTRFDRVYRKAADAKERNLMREEITKDKKVFVMGSSWSEDEEVLVPVIKKLLKADTATIFIIVPHEPNIEHLERLENEFSPENRVIRFSFLNSYKNERVILVDSIGILLTLYYYADTAFVGGSFKSSIHNVLEAAVYGIPVLYGPKIQSSQEAMQLAIQGGGIIVHNKIEAYKYLRRLLSDENYRKRCGSISRNFVEKNLGASDVIVKKINSFL